MRQYINQISLTHITHIIMKKFWIWINNISLTSYTIQTSHNKKINKSQSQKRLAKRLHVPQRYPKQTNKRSEWFVKTDRTIKSITRTTFRGHEQALKHLSEFTKIRDNRAISGYNLKRARQAVICAIHYDRPPGVGF